MRKNSRKKFPLIFPLIFLSILLAIFFFQFNTFVSETYKIKNYEREIAKISKENENLEMGFVEKNHLKGLEQIAENLNFEKAGKVHYIRVLEGTVVTK